MGIKLGLAGLGAFGTVFAPLFASHPLVNAIYLWIRYRITYYVDCMARQL